MNMQFTAPSFGNLAFGLGFGQCQSSWGGGLLNSVELWALWKLSSPLRLAFGLGFSLCTADLGGGTVQFTVYGQHCTYLLSLGWHSGWVSACKLPTWGGGCPMQCPWNAVYLLSSFRLAFGLVIDLWLIIGLWITDLKGRGGAVRIGIYGRH